jgi:predicted transcriptional regulator
LAFVYNEDTKRYEITAKGQRFMDVYEKMDEILKVEEII